MTFAPCAIIPVFDHHSALPRLVVRLREQGLPLILVDDGSGLATRTVLDDLAECEGVSIERFAENRGKGAAVMHGLESAARCGFTHAVQIDADGQHDAQEASALLALAREQPKALISGVPRYDDSVPLVRYYGRWLTHLLVWAETLSCDLTDTMCGFRVYPVAETLAVAERKRIGARMDFDTEAMVRLYLAGMPVKFFPVTVRYPADGISHFRMVRDNARMTWLHLRLLAGLPWRALSRMRSGRGV